MTIFKVQRPLVTNDPDQHWRLDPKSGQPYFIKEHMVPEKMKRFMGAKFKTFMEISLKLNDAGRLTINKIKRTHWREW